jgi:ankyrin repeat protein
MTFWKKIWCSEETTSLHEAVKIGDLPAVQKIIAAGVDVAEPDGRGAPALQLAAARGHLEIARLLIKSGADVNFVTEGMGTPLMGAAACLQPDMIKLLICHDADPNKKGFDGRFPLICPYRPGALAVDRQLKCIRLLVANGANVNERAADGGTPLMSAAWFGNNAAAVELLRLGADPSLRNANHETAAMRAAERGHEDLAKHLKPKFG